MAITYESLDELATEVVQALGGSGLTLALAESATGGLVAHTLSNTPGCSKVLLASLVVYSAQGKAEVLDVDWGIINEFGTISPEVTEALLHGLDRVGADIQVAITGVMGQPLEGKPMGTMYLGVKSRFGASVVAMNVRPADAGKLSRIQIKILATKAVLDRILEEAEKFDGDEDSV
jgi:PncC family amidohydrolase